MYQNLQSTHAATAQDALSRLNVSKEIIATLQWMSAVKFSIFRRRKKNCVRKILTFEEDEKMKAATVLDVITNYMNDAKDRVAPTT